MIRFRAKGWKERDLATRLSTIVCGDPLWKPEVTCQVSASGVPEVKDADGLPPLPRKWQLDTSNNHFLNPRPDVGLAVYDYNYRYGDPVTETAFATTLSWLLGVEIL